MDTMVALLEEIHPAPFAACPEEEFRRQVEAVRAQLPDSADIFGVYQALEPLTALLGDGHTQLNFPRSRFTGDERVFPLAVRVGTSDSTIVLDQSYRAIPAGARIVAIDGVPSRRIVERMLAWHSGERTFFRLVKTSINFTDLFWLLHPAECFEVEYLHDGRLSRQTLDAIPRREVRNDFLVEMLSPPPFSYRIDRQRDAAILSIKSLSGKKEAFGQLIQQMFAEMEALNIGHLIVDLRYNGGGDSGMGDLLIARISDKPFNQFARMDIKMSDATRRMNEQWADSSGMLTFHTTHFVEPRPAQERYRGEVFVLTGPMTFSSASSLAGSLQRAGARVVGEESGGMSVSYGNILASKLPNSGITLAVSFARMHLWGSDVNDIHGVLPDISVPADEALDEALALSVR